MPVPKFQPKVKQIRKKSLNPESKMQESCFTWFRYQWSEYSGKYFAIPNGGYRNYETAKQMKREGQMAGVHDTFLMVSRHGWHGLWIEFKYGKNTLSDDQIDFAKACDEEGYKWVVCYTLEEFILIINSYLSNGKERNQPNYRVHPGEH